MATANGDKKLWWILATLIALLTTVVTCLAAAIDKRVTREEYLRDAARIEQRMNGLLTEKQFQAHVKYMSDNLELIRKDIGKVSDKVDDLQKHGIAKRGGDGL